MDFFRDTGSKCKLDSNEATQGNTPGSVGQSARWHAGILQATRSSAAHGACLPTVKTGTFNSHIATSHLSACVVTRSETRRPSSSLKSALFCTLGFHARRDLRYSIPRVSEQGHTKGCGISAEAHHLSGVSVRCETDEPFRAQDLEGRGLAILFELIGKTAQITKRLRQEVICCVRGKGE